MSENESLETAQIPYLLCVETVISVYAELAIATMGKAGLPEVNRKLSRLDFGILPQYIFLN